jgi:hypothetical protein
MSGKEIVTNFCYYSSIFDIGNFIHGNLKTGTENWPVFHDIAFYKLTVFNYVFISVFLVNTFFYEEYISGMFFVSDPDSR